MEAYSQFLPILQDHGYGLIGPIGKGGFATCFKVSSLKYSDQTFVCKVGTLPTNLLDGRHKASAVNAYEQEIEALSSIIHPHVVKIYDHFIDSSYLFLILEYCTNGSLDQVIEKHGGVPPHQLLTLVKQFASALAYCHSIRLAHHDIKPANLLLDFFGRVKLADFGLAAKQSNLCETYSGSLAFMAPEVLEKKPYDPFKADIWSFGATVYNMATGELPFCADSIPTLRKMINIGMYRIPTGIHPTIQAIIKNTLVVNPQKRWSIMEVTQAINAVSNEIVSLPRINSKSSINQSKSSLLSFALVRKKSNLRLTAPVQSLSVKSKPEIVRPMPLLTFKD